MKEGRAVPAAIRAGLAGGFVAMIALAAPAAWAQAPEPKEGGVLRVAFEGDPNCVDPQQVGNNTALNIGRQLTDSLTDQHPETGEIVPWLAKEWTVSADSREFTFRLRDGVTFSDGTPFDAAAVKANFEGIVALGARSSLGSTYLNGLESIETPAADTVVIRFKQPSAQFLQATSTMSLGFFAASTLGTSPEERCQGKLAGTGPFTLTEFVNNQHVRLARRDDYNWPSSLATHAGKAWLEGIHIRIIPESGVRIGSLVSGQIDVNTGVLPQDERLLEAQKFPILARPNPGVVYNLFPNEARPIADERAVRVAISKAVNREELRAVISKFQNPAIGALARTTPLYKDQSADLVFDPEGAKKLLDEAGWVPGADGIRARDGKPLSFKLTYWQNAPFLELVQQQLRAVGIDLQLDRSTISQVNAIQASKQFAFQFYNLTRADPDVLRTVFVATGRNVNARAPGEVDDLLTQSSATLDTGTRRDLIARASDILVREGHSIPLVELTTVIATGKNIHGLHFEASSRLQFYDTWIAR
ncbi:MAG: ABC transporter substrate-binding protein [Pseudochelatococcus sp.]|jgi:peptide/nickel transport system substrate-binding protein|uniref:ABC transporter substrate-binding protein n=1 Tax=Pseudochelatococcus sp. TaxID=2020869 RepID=UPI003D908221